MVCFPIMEHMEEMTLSPAKPAPILGKHPFFFIQFLFLAFGFGISYCLVGVYRQGEETLPLNLFSYYLGMSITFLMGLVILVIAHRNFQARVRPLYLLLSLLYVAMNLVAILTFPSAYTAGDSYIYEIGTLGRIHDILLGTLLAYAIYLFFAIFPQCLRNETGLDWVLRAYVLFICLTIAWSLYAEWDHYVAIFSHAEEVYAFRSFTSHKNAYGFMLLLGIFAEAVLQDRHARFWRYIFIALFFLCLISSLSKTALALALLFLAYFLLERFIRTVKKHPVRNLLSLAILAMVIGTYFALTRAGVFPQSIYLNYIKNYIEHFSEGSNTVDSRKAIWERVWSLLFYQDKPYWVYGYGVHNFNFVLGYNEIRTIENVGYAHNAFLEAVGTNGVFVTGCYVLFYLGIFVTLLRATCHRHPGVWPTYLAFFFMLLLRCSMESDGLFLLNVHSFLIDILWTWPILAKANAYRTKSQLEQDALNEYCQRVLPSSAPKSRFALLIVFLLSTGAMSACFGMNWWLEETTQIWGMSLWIGFAVIAFIAWICSIVFAQKKFLTALLGLLYLGISLGLAVLYRYLYGGGDYVSFALLQVGIPLWGFFYAIPFSRSILPPYFAFVPEAERKHNASHIRHFANGH